MPAFRHLIETAKERFVAFRGGNAFIGTLIVFLVCYELAHHFLGIDPDRSTANYWLSVEASTATCLLLDFAVKNMAADRSTFAKIIDLEERILATETAIRDWSE